MIDKKPDESLKHGIQIALCNCPVPHVHLEFEQRVSVVLTEAEFHRLAEMVAGTSRAMKAKLPLGPGRAPDH